MAKEALNHYLDGSGDSMTIPIEKVLSGSKSHNAAVAALINQLPNLANEAILASGKLRRVSTQVTAYGINQNGDLGNWDYHTMNEKENADLFAAYNGIEWAATAHVTANREGESWSVNLDVTLTAHDPYDWEAWDVDYGLKNKASTPASVFGIPHTDISRLHQLGWASEYLRSGTQTFSFGYTFVP